MNLEIWKCHWWEPWRGLGRKMWYVVVMLTCHEMLQMNAHDTTWLWFDWHLPICFTKLESKMTWPWNIYIYMNARSNSELCAAHALHVAMIARSCSQNHLSSCCHEVHQGFHQNVVGNVGQFPILRGWIAASICFPVSNLLATGCAMASARHSVSMSWFVSPVFTCW